MRIIQCHHFKYQKNKIIIDEEKSPDSGIVQRRQFPALQMNVIILTQFYQHMLQVAPDSLDQQRQLYQRSQSVHSSSPPPPAQDKLYKQFYRQQLDTLVQQKTEQRRVQKHQEELQRNAYNQRITHAIEAERMKDLSYKNYYHMLLDNQSNISKNYVSPFDQKLQQKQRLVRQGVEETKKRNDYIHEQEQRRQEEARKNYRESLAEQINEKYSKNVVDSTVKVKQNEDFKKLTYTPQELAKFERQRRVMEMQRYRQDLDKTNPRQRSSTNYPNDFNVRVQSQHNPMVNPLPYNIQNPYILKQMQRKMALQQDNNTSRYY